MERLRTPRLVSAMNELDPRAIVSPSARVGQGVRIGAFAVVAGLLFVNKVGAGPFAGLTITANILMSLVIDKFGWFGMDIHPLNGWRMIGAALMVAGIALIARF